MSGKTHEARYKSIEIPKFDDSKIPPSYLQSMSEPERDIIKKISMLEQAVEFQLRTIAVKNFIIEDIDKRLQSTEQSIDKQNRIMKPLIYVGGIVMPIIIVSITTYVAKSLN